MNHLAAQYGSAAFEGSKGIKLKMILIPTLIFILKLNIL